MDDASYILEKLRRDDDDVKEGIESLALSDVEELGDEFLQPLIDSLNHQEDMVIALSLLTLADHFPFRAAEHILGKIGHPEELVRYATCRALSIMIKTGWRIDKTFVESSKNSLVQILNDDSDFVSLCAAICLGDLGDSSGLEILISALTDVVFSSSLGLLSFDLENDIIESLGSCGNPIAANALCEHLENTLAIFDETGDINGLICHIVEALGNLGSKDSLTHLYDLLNTEDSNLRDLVVTAIGEIGDNGSLPYIQNMTKDENYIVRGRAAGILGKEEFQDISSLSILRNICQNDESDWTKAWAATSLGHLGDEEDLPLLKSLVQNNDDLLSSDAEMLSASAEISIKQIKTR